MKKFRVTWESEDGRTCTAEFEAISEHVARCYIAASREIEKESITAVDVL